jgi:DNA (cytosine-5)-methyltransferase 1
MQLSGTWLRTQREHLGLSQAKLAELSGLPQHMLSGFELQKLELSRFELDAIVLALSDRKRIGHLSRRPKRYQEHVYTSVPRLPERIAKASCTLGNREYLHTLGSIWNGHIRAKTASPSVVSLFSGCGGFSLGFSAAGFRIVGHAELDRSLRDIYKMNFPASTELGVDVAEINEQTLNTFKARFEPVEVVIGGPPCQGFSLAGKRKSADPRNTLFRHYLRVVDHLRPRIAIMENVRLLTSMRDPDGGLVRDKICGEFVAHGYKVKSFEVNAKDYGVPQHRERVIFVGIRSDVEATPSIPDPTHGESVDIFGATSPYLTFGDACSDLPFLESGESGNDNLHAAVSHPEHVIKWLWDVPEGHSAHENSDAGMRPPSGYNTTYKRQRWNEPASTVQTTFGMISGCRNVHPIATRSLTIREAARIQSFPDSYSFAGSLGSIRTGIGNAVPPLLAYRVATHIRSLLKK